MKIKACLRQSALPEKCMRQDSFKLAFTHECANWELCTKVDVKVVHVLLSKSLSQPRGIPVHFVVLITSTPNVAN